MYLEEEDEEWIPDQAQDSSKETKISEEIVCRNMGSKV